MTLRDKVDRSSLIVVGRVVRVLFVDAKSRDLPDLAVDPVGHLDNSPEAEVLIEEVLLNRERLRIPQRIRYVLPNTATSAAAKRMKYEGLAFIWFGEIREVPRGNRAVWQMAFPAARVSPDAEPESTDRVIEVRALLGTSQPVR
jgi:hypothetical protein